MTITTELARRDALAIDRLEVSLRRANEMIREHLDEKVHLRSALRDAEQERNRLQRLFREVANSSAAQLADANTKLEDQLDEARKAARAGKAVGPWMWIGDSFDHLESMGDEMAVRITAGHLRQLLAAQVERCRRVLTGHLLTDMQKLRDLIAKVTNEGEPTMTEPIDKHEYTERRDRRVAVQQNALDDASLAEKLVHCASSAGQITALVLVEDHLAAVMAAEVLAKLVDDVRDELAKRIRDGKLMLEENGLIE